jgi:hypothetical protein
MGRTTNVARRRAEAASARERAALARTAAAQRERRRRLLVGVGSVVAVLAVLGALVAVGIGNSHPRGDTTRAAAPPAVVQAVSSVPPATLAAVGSGTVSSLPKAIKDTPLTSGGQPEILYVGAEFCPYCAAERWSLVQALSRFGSFNGLKIVHSSSTDVFPNTSTFSFYGATYTSNAVTFVGREDETVTGAQLEKPTAAETALWTKYTGQGSFPFIDIGGRYVITTPNYDPAVLKGLTAQQIAGQLADPTSKVAKAVDGAANVLTAAICKTTNGAPASVCTAAGVVAAAKTLGG